MSGWETCTVPDSFVKNKVGRQNQIPAKDIAEVGRFPVVDQSQPPENTKPSNLLRSPSYGGQEPLNQ